MNRKAQRVAWAAAFSVLVLGVASCAHRPQLRWPWHARATAPPRPVEVVAIRSEDGVPVRAFPQYWLRNTLLIDLSGAAPSGTIVLGRREAGTWPVRLAFRVRPAEIKMLEVSAAQRLLMPTSTEAGDQIELEVTPGVYARDTQSITVRW